MFFHTSVLLLFLECPLGSWLPSFILNVLWVFSCPLCILYGVLFLGKSSCFSYVLLFLVASIVPPVFSAVDFDVSDGTSLSVAHYNICFATACLFSPPQPLFFFCSFLTFKIILYILWSYITNVFKDSPFFPIESMLMHTHVWFSHFSH